MSKAIITSYTLLDFLSEGDMLAFFTFVEEHMEGHAANLRVHGMTKFYVSRVFNKGDKYTIGNWLEYRDMEAYEACDKVWQESGAEFAEKYGHLFEGVTVTPHRGEVMDDYT